MTPRSPSRDWFDDTDPTGSGPGLRFACTMCGNCCTGPEGYVLFTEEEGDAIAAKLGLTREKFLERYTKQTPLGTSLAEKQSTHGLDCIFLDRETIPGKAVCGIYEHRPAQCRTWPFWNEIVATRQSWDRANRTCPGINKGTLIPPDQIRILRDKVP
jgi:Fe-S-cluster containining protein